MKLKEFKDLLFFHCYDCGWGERGVHARLLTFDEAYKVILYGASKAAADEWAHSEYDEFDFGISSIMISKRAFVEADWVGSNDY